MKPFVPAMDVKDVIPLRTWWEDGERVFRRAWRDEVGGERRQVLVVVPAAKNPTATNLDRFAHEYSLKNHLDAAWALQPLDLVHERGLTTLILEDPGGEPLQHLLESPMRLPKFLSLAVAMAAALRGLHAHGLIHKDINPANILVKETTGQAWLTGFGITSRLPRERQAPAPPETLAGTLAYMAPEQTGRMNRSIDSRSDLYALGVTFYRMLTGVLPFTATDPMEWVHCHIARAPIPPQERLSAIPAAISQLVMKLLAKTAEERYQTAAGVEHDLRRCLTELESRGRIEEFPLAGHDAPDRLLIPEKLYGREQEVAALLGAFDNVVQTGVPALVLVSGYSGIGKSSVVNELHKVLAPPRGLFAAGKFDQYKRDIPYATLAQAFQSLVRQILSKSEAELQHWRQAIGEALDANGQLIIDLIPELAVVIGQQSPVPDLAPQDAQRRFQMVLRRFIGVFARPEHPLALFLDDLQWLDAATLDLLEDLLTQGDIRHLLLVGAYRDNEVDNAHPLARKLDTIRRAGATVRDIVLVPLSHNDLGQLIADSLHCEPKSAVSLLHLVQEKTGGNPFFSIQFLHALADEALLVFDHADARWSWDLGRIHAKCYTDNVVDLMVAKLHRLPGKTQATLHELACVGTGATFALLGTACQTSQEDLHDNIWEAVRSGLVLRSENSYAFQHDRIQEAAYSRVPEDVRAEAHLRIGRLLLARTPPDKREKLIFDIVNQLNRGAGLITSEDERLQVAELNLVAGKRAKASAANASALQYFIAGEALLPSEIWELRHELIFQLELHRAECEFLSGAVTVAAERVAMLELRALNTVDLATAACLGIDVYQALGQVDRAVAICLNYLHHVAIDWPLHPTDEHVRSEYERIWSQLASREIEEVLDFPLMSDSTSIATLDVLTKALTTAMFADWNLLALIVCRAVSLSVERGNHDGSCVNYVWLGIIAGHGFGDYENAFRFARIGYELVEKRGLKRFQPATYVRFASRIMPWMAHPSRCCEVIRQAFGAANETGDVTNAAYCCLWLSNLLVATGDPLVNVQREAESGFNFTRKAQFGVYADMIIVQLGLIRTLRGLTTTFGSLDHAEFDEIQFERDLDSKPPRVHCWYWIRKLQARFFAGDFDLAIEASLNARPLLLKSPSFELAEYEFYGALARAARCDSAMAAQSREHYDALKAHHKQIEIWAEHCPENFENNAALVGAELARIEDRALDAEVLYERAIRSAHANGFAHNEALAYELAARFYAARGLQDFAEVYVVKARDGYRRWGADGKVRQLETRYPHLVVADPRGATPGAPSPDQQLDVAAVVKASQALSSEMLLPRLIERLMTIALQNAGADRGLLILPHQTDYRIEVEARADGEGVTLQYAASEGLAVPDTIIRYVMRTQENVIIDDAAKHNFFSEDPYLTLRRPRSILCLPLVRQGALSGLLYLENTLAPHVFTPERASLLEVLASQAAISLENATLYTDLQRNEVFLSQGQQISQTGSFGWNAASQELYWSQGIYSILEYDRSVKASYGLTMDRTHPDDRALFRRVFDDAMSDIKDYEVEHRLLMPDGRVKHVHVIGRAVHTGNLDLVGAVRDITEHKRVEALARESERRYHEIQTELEHANRVATMGQLSASIAHEVNQPLSGAVVSAETALLWLTADKPNLAEAKKAMTRVVRDGNRASEVLRRIRTLIRKAPPQRDSLAINDVIREIIALTQGEAARCGVQLQTRLGEELPLIQGDRVQLQQVVLNLMMNALDAIRGAQDDGPREILISTGNADAGGVHVCVRDSGPGIDPASIERLFDAFYTTKSEGLGMGLPICRSIIEAHGGKLWVTPNDPRGAVFQFTLPADGGR